MFRSSLKSTFNIRLIHYRTFHFLVGTNVALALARSLISMILHGTTNPEKAQALDKLLWIILQSYMLFTEICVLVFGVCGSQFDSLRQVCFVLDKPAM